MAFLRGRPMGRLVRGGGPAPPPDDEGDDSPKARPVTSIYERGRAVTETGMRKQGPRLHKDVVFTIMADGRYHSVHELSNLPGFAMGEWFVALGQLVEAGYEFHRISNSLRMKKCEYGADRQDLLTLLLNIDGREPEDVNPRRAHQIATEQIRFEQGTGSPPERDDLVPYEAEWLETQEREVGADDGDVPSSSPPFEQEAVSQPAQGDQLFISADKSFVLPARTSVTSTRAILAMKGSGKTYLAGVVAEEFLCFPDKILPFVVIDPTGVWYGLSSLANGHPSPNPVMILGGENGDVPISPDQGKIVAEIIVEKWPTPVIIDVSEFYPEDQHLFVADFGAKLYAINRRPLHMFIDEADEFAPQQIDSTYKHQRRCFHVIDRIVRRGRSRGLGVTAITQRPAVLHKNILTQVDGIMVMKMVAPHDLEAVRTWMKPVMTNSDQEQCLHSLPKLDRGEGFFMQGGSQVIPCLKFMARPKTTFDSSRTPSVDEPKDVTAPSLGHVDEEILRYATRMLGGKVSENGDDSETE